MGLYVTIDSIIGTAWLVPKRLMGRFMVIHFHLQWLRVFPHLAIFNVSTVLTPFVCLFLNPIDEYATLALSHSFKSAILCSYFSPDSRHYFRHIWSEYPIFFPRACADSLVHYLLLPPYCRGGEEETLPCVFPHLATGLLSDNWWEPAGCWLQQERGGGERRTCIFAIICYSKTVGLMLVEGSEIRDIEKNS